MPDYDSSKSKVETARSNFSNKKDPKKEGYYKGTVYYAANMPKSKKDEIPFDKARFDQVMDAMKHDASQEEVGKAMMYLSEIGYYDGEIDSLKGPMFMGAAKRLQYNKQDDNFLEEAKNFDFMKWWRGESK